MSEVKELPKEFQSLIKKHLPFYEDLHCGRREPSTPSQVHFVDVACGKTTKTLTIHEQAYMAWLTYKKLTYKKDYAAGNKKKQNKKQEKRKNSRTLSAASVKKTIKKEKIKKKISNETAHRISGIREIRAHFVSGGAVRPK